MEARPADQSVADRMKSDPLDNLRAPAPPSMRDAGADAGSEAPVNPRKRKKASRAYVAGRHRSSSCFNPHTHTL